MPLGSILHDVHQRLVDVGVRLAQPSHTVMAIASAASDHRGAVEALISGLSGSGKPLIHSSGGSIVADLAVGEPFDRIFDEMTPIVPLTERAARIAIDQPVAYGPRHPISGALQSMIYGSALGLRRQHPDNRTGYGVRAGRTRCAARYIGRGLNRGRNVHIADVAALYVLAIGRAPAEPLHVCREWRGALGVSSEQLRPGSVLGMRNPYQPKRRRVLGPEPGGISGSNSRVRGRAAVNLGWLPAHRSITRWIASDLI